MNRAYAVQIDEPRRRGQKPDGLIEATLAHENVGVQVLALGFELGRHPAVDFLQGISGLVQITARVPDLREIEPRPVAHTRRNIIRQQGLEALAGLVVHAERKIESAEQQLPLGFMMRNVIPMLVRREAGDRLEVVVLEEIEEHIAIVKIANPRLRQLLRIVASRGRGPGGHDGGRHA